MFLAPPLIPILISPNNLSKGILYEELQITRIEEMFTNVQREMNAAGKVYDPFISKLNDIRTAMSMDLNRNGLNAMRPIADKAKADAKVINARLDGAISALSKAATALAASGWWSPPKKSINSIKSFYVARFWEQRITYINRNKVNSINRFSR